MKVNDMTWIGRLLVCVEVHFTSICYLANNGLVALDNETFVSLLLLSVLHCYYVAVSCHLHCIIIV